MSPLPALLPKAVCLGWDTPLIWLQASADIVTIIAYLFLSVVMVRILWTRPSINTDPLMRRIYAAWAALFFCGGLERSVNVAILWQADYYYWQTVAKWLTASVTIGAGSLIVLTLVPALVTRETRLAQAEAHIRTLMDDMSDSLEGLRDHNTRALEKVAALEQYIQEPATLASTPAATMFADLRTMLQALHEELAKA